MIQPNILSPRAKFVLEEAFKEIDSGHRPLLCAGKSPIQKAYNDWNKVYTKDDLVQLVVWAEERGIKLDTVGRVLQGSEYALDFDDAETYELWRDQLRDSILNKLTEIKSPIKEFPHIHFRTETPEIDRTNVSEKLLSANGWLAVKGYRITQLPNGKEKRQPQASIELKFDGKYITVARYAEATQTNKMSVVQGDRYDVGLVSSEEFWDMIHAAEVLDRRTPEDRTKIEKYKSKPKDPNEKLTDEERYIAYVAANFNATFGGDLEKLGKHLEQFGYSVQGKSFTRPGKAAKDGFSGIISETNHYQLYSTSDSAYEYGRASREGVGHTPFSILAHYQNDSDQLDAAKQLGVDLKLIPFEEYTKPLFEPIDGVDLEAALVAEITHPKPPEQEEDEQEADAENRWKKDFYPQQDDIPQHVVEGMPEAFCVLWRGFAQSMIGSTKNAALLAAVSAMGAACGKRVGFKVAKHYHRCDVACVDINYSGSSKTDSLLSAKEQVMEMGIWEQALPCQTLQAFFDKEGKPMLKHLPASATPVEQEQRDEEIQQQQEEWKRLYNSKKHGTWYWSDDSMATIQMMTKYNDPFNSHVESSNFCKVVGGGKLSEEGILYGTRTHGEIFLPDRSRSWFFNCTENFNDLLHNIRATEQGIASRFFIINSLAAKFTPPHEINDLAMRYERLKHRIKNFWNPSPAGSDKRSRIEIDDLPDDYHVEDEKSVELNFQREIMGKHPEFAEFWNFDPSMAKNLRGKVAMYAKRIATLWAFVEWVDTLEEEPTGLFKLNAGKYYAPAWEFVMWTAVSARMWYDSSSNPDNIDCERVMSHVKKTWREYQNTKNERLLKRITERGIRQYVHVKGIAGYKTLQQRISDIVRILENDGRVAMQPTGRTKYLYPLTK